jgi:DNA ligase (NAD+)
MTKINKYIDENMRESMMGHGIESKMEEQMKNLVEELAAKILVARDEYYNGTPSMTDDEYDAIEFELRKLDADHEVLKKVGAEPTSTWPKVKHDIPMGSLDKAQNADNFLAWAHKYVGDKYAKAFSASDKVDGISIEMRYNKGVFFQAITRGDGVTGEDISPNVRKMHGFCQQLPTPFTGSVRGEIVLFKADWRRFMSDKKNPRGAACGTAKRLDGDKCQHLNLLMYEVIGDGTRFDSDAEKFISLREWGFNLPYAKSNLSAAEVVTFMADRATKRDDIPYEIDGLVVRIDNQDDFEAAGSHDMNPKGEPEKKPTTVRSITWQVGRAGRVTPVAELEPVDIGGATISRVSLHTARMAVESDAGPGAKVIISRRNDVIPYMEKVLAESNVDAPTKCPLCKDKLEWEGEYLQCNNATCPAVLHSAVKVWTTRLDVLHWGDALVETLINEGYVKTLPDIYKIKWDKFSVDHGRIAVRAMTSLKEHEEMTLAQFIAALNIRHCQTTAKDIVSAGYDTVEKFMSLNESTLASISGIGPVKAAFIAAGIKQLTSVVSELVKFITIKQPKKGTMTGTSFCFTGAAARPRKELQAMAENAGAEVKDSVGKGLTYLVMADPTSTSSKAEKARKLGTKCISEEDFVKMVS